MYKVLIMQYTYDIHSVILSVSLTHITQEKCFFNHRHCIAIRVLISKCNVVERSFIINVTFPRNYKKCTHPAWGSCNVCASPSRTSLLFPCSLTNFPSSKVCWLSNTQPISTVSNLNVLLLTSFCCTTPDLKAPIFYYPSNKNQHVICT